MVVLLLNFLYSVSESSDKLPTSLVYFDTSVNPNKLLGHVKIYEFDEENSVKFDYGNIVFYSSVIKNKYF